MVNPRLEKAIEDAKAEIDKEIDQFKAALDAGTENPDSFITLAEIEKKWAELRNNTTKPYSAMLSAYLSDLDETALIKSKKENSSERG